jgi:hypothetical protein
MVVGNVGRAILRKSGRFMILDDLKFVFLHPSKTGGTSIEQYFNVNYGINKFVPHFFIGVDSKGIECQHASAQYIKDYTSKFDTYYKFMTTRNPYSRMYSIYRFGLFSKSLFSLNKTFKQFVCSLPSLMNNPLTKNGNHLTPQYLYSHIDGCCVVDKILKMENLDSDFEFIKQKFNRTEELNNIDLGIKRNQIKDISLLYDREMIQIINDCYSEDFDFFGYQKTEKSKDNNDLYWNFLYLIDTNILNNKPWYFGLEDNWWWGLNEEQFLDRLCNSR